MDMSDFYNSLLSQNGIQTYTPPSTTLPQVNIASVQPDQAPPQSQAAPSPIAQPAVSSASGPTAPQPIPNVQLPTFNPDTSGMMNALSELAANPDLFNGSGSPPTNQGPSSFGSSKPIAGNTNFDPLVEKYSSQYGLDPDLVRRVISAESSGKTGVVSSAGAKGLMQLTDDSFTDYGPKNGDVFDPDDNINAGTKELSTYMNKYGGDGAKALAAYNWGPGNVDRLLKQGRWDYNNLPAETQQYLKRLGYA